MLQLKKIEECYKNQEELSLKSIKFINFYKKSNHRKILYLKKIINVIIYKSKK